MEIIAVGASQGGVPALKTLVAGLPRNFATPILVVLHVGTERSILPSILSDPKGLTASHAVQGEPVRPGHILIAPPDQHMLVVDGHIRLSHGPRENWARPAIDPLFRSVAHTYGPGAAGIILSGTLNDGTAGLYEIKQRAGIAIVQDPADAEAASMPLSALANVAVDYTLPISEIPALLTRLATNSGKIAAGSSGAFAMKSHNFASPAAQTCPDCGGAMRDVQVGTLMQFHCHIGHVMSAQVLAAAKLETLQNNISACVRAANERTDLCKEIARKCRAGGDAAAAALWGKAADEAAGRAQLLADVADTEWMHPENAAGTTARAASG